MKHLKKILIVVAGVLLLSSGAYAAGPRTDNRDFRDPVQELDATMKAINYVYGLIKQSEPYDAKHPLTERRMDWYRAKLERYFDTIQDPDVLKTIAVHCFHQSFEGGAMDDEFGACFDVAVAEMSFRKGEAAKEAFHALHERLPLDGAFAVVVDECEWSFNHRHEKDKAGKDQKRE